MTTSARCGDASVRGTAHTGKPDRRPRRYVI
jgi:hypothetical protein